MLSPPDNWQGCAVQSFTVQTNGSAWIGTEGGGLYHFDEHGQWTTFGETNGLSNAFVWSVLVTKAGELYVGTWGGGLVVKRGDRFESPGDLAQITEPVLSLYEGKRGELWIGTRSGIYRSEKNKLTWFAGKEKLFLPDVRAIAETPDGTLWFGMSGGGLGVLRDSLLRQIRKGDGLGSDYVVCLDADLDGTLWIGTSDNGLIRLKDGKFSHVSTRQGLPSNIIYHIVDDGADHLWLGSLEGIWRIRKDDLDRGTNSPTIRPLSYGKAEGLASQSCSGGFQPGGCRSSDGRLWFPTAKGMAIINPVTASTNNARPPVIIEEVIVNSAEIPANRLAMIQGVSNDGDCVRQGRLPSTTSEPPETETLRLVPGSRRFVFHFTALSFAAPDKVRFKIKLEPIDSDWSGPDTGRSKDYSILSPGNYKFRVIACNNDDVWNDAGACLAFTIRPYFWQTGWFQTVAFVASAALVAGVVGVGVLWLTRRRLRLKLEQLERQRALERERARIARDIHDDLGASLTRITMLSQSVRSEVEGQPQAAADVDQIYATARELTRAMDEIVWAVNPEHDTLDSLVTYLGRFAQHFLSAAGLRCRLDVPVHLPAWSLSAETRHNVFLAFKESLNNVVTHAQATEVRISMEVQPRSFVLIIGDNGCGFDLQRMLTRPVAPTGQRFAPGNGLVNMRKRLEEIGGRCEWQSAPREGTKVKLVVELRA
jgi:signal transduction histidine kinase